MKKIIKTIVFLLIFFIIFVAIFDKLWLKKNSLSYFFEEPKNSFDVVYVGSSNAFIHFNTTLAFDTWGFTTGLLSASSQSFITTKYLIKQSQKYQNPKLYVIDLGLVATDFDIFTEENVRVGTDVLMFSKNRIDLINEILKYDDKIDKNSFNYYFSFMLYHNRWKDIFKGSLDRQNLNVYKGYSLTDDSFKTLKKDSFKWYEKTGTLQDENYQVLLELLDYLDNEKINVLFVVPARPYENAEMARINDAVSIIESRNYKVINFNTLDDFDINYSTDLKDTCHLNVWGSTKYTLYFSKYLINNYDLPNHKSDKNFASWEEEYKRFKNSYFKKTNEKFEIFLNKEKQVYN